MYPDPLWFCVSYLYTRARQRARAALDGNPESGALSLEWLVIGGVVVLLALAAYAIFSNALKTWTADLTKGS